MTYRIVVGVDGSAPAGRALGVAIEQARLHDDAVVHPIHAWRPTSWLGPPDHVGKVTSHEDMRAAAQRLLADALADVPDDITLDPATMEGSPAAVLLRLAEDADLVVVGTRGRGGFADLRIGSTSQHLTAHSPCPVLVVPAGARPTS